MSRPIQDIAGLRSFTSNSGAEPASPRQNIERESRKIYQRELEKHLADVKKGTESLSKETASKIKNNKLASTQKIARGSSGGLKDYLGYSTALSYEQNARMSEALTRTTEAIDEMA